MEALLLSHKTFYHPPERADFICEAYFIRASEFHASKGRLILPNPPA